MPLDPESIDLAVSLLSLQDENDIPGMLIQIRRALKPDGLFLGVMAGSGTLAELRESLLAAETEIYGGASPRVIPFADVRDAGALLQRAGFALPVADVETVTVRYATHVRPDGGSAGDGRDQRRFWRARAVRRRASFSPAPREIYAERFADPDGRDQGDVLVRLDVGMGAGRLAAEAAEAGFGEGVAGKIPGRSRRTHEPMAEASVPKALCRTGWRCRSTCRSSSCRSRRRRPRWPAK